MATYRTRKKKDGTISVTATVRKVGVAPLTETFNESTKAKAMQEAKFWVAEVEAGIYRHKTKSPEAAKIKLEDFFTAYFEHLDLTGRKRASTIRNEKFSEKQILRLLDKNTLLCDITTAHITAYRDERIREGVGASKIRSEIALISCLFKFAIQEKGFNLENPVGPGRMWRPPAPRGKVDSLTEEEIKRFLAECRKVKNKKLAAYVAILINTGMRPGEAAQLRVHDVNIANRSIHLEETKNGSSRDIPLTNTAFSEILPLVDGRELDDFVFWEGKELPKSIAARPAQLFRDSFDQARERAGVSRITRHGMRHTAATHMLRNGISLRVIAEVLGHKTLQMAMKYTHPDKNVLRAAVDTLDSLID